MEPITGKVIPVSIENEVKTSYLNYAMSVIVSRALPDVRDGLKPVHRRILYSMHEMGLRADRAYKKCGRIVGDVLGKYHPHGDASIYDALVRLAQDFSMRYPVVNGQGNFGSVDGDPPAAMRYTEARMHKITEDILKDIKKDTVDFGPNYDDSLLEPLVLPTGVPYLIVNGASGIAVGMATNMAPHNLREVCAGICAYIDDPDISIEDMMREYIKGPDFPTGAIIFGQKGTYDAYRYGRGKIVVRARHHIEVIKSGKEAIIITELPYMVNKANLVVRIADLIKDKKVEGITDLRDESDRNGMRVVIELKKGTVSDVVLNTLYTHTALQSNFSANNLALVDGKPQLLNLLDQIRYFVAHRKDVIIRRTKYDLNKAEERAHILEGLKIALENIDEVVEIIKKSGNVSEARLNLMDRFQLSEKQSQAILDMRLQKLTSLETKKIIDELQEVLSFIEYCKDLLANEYKIFNLIKDETTEISNKYGDDRRTEIRNEELDDVDIEDLIQQEDMVVVMSNDGFIKRVSVSLYNLQGRGGKGSKSANLRDEDFVSDIFVANTHDYILSVTNLGNAYWTKVYNLPEGTRTSKGRHIKGLLNFEENEEITAVVSLKDFSEETYLFMATKHGVTKRVKTHDFRNARQKGIRAIILDDGDTLVSALLTNGDDEVMLVTRNGLGLRFNENLVRSMGRVTRGVRGINLVNDDSLIGVTIVNDDMQMFLLSENGYGKRLEYHHFNPHGRGTKGQCAYKTNDKSGKVIGVTAVDENWNVMCITNSGKTIKIDPQSISVFGKTAFGVKIVTPGDGEKVVGLAKSEKDAEENIIE
ncbi:DNA topoisomerase (ATP-hydrolyzing) subunit A [Spirochaeta cellobiosiphila]|uniref:DNA topoisomerase (ATP-hydrolyzing) subunit A n=1 Tax=Spirochaeta cellobiosiphila TaxID=504483 RepID=UPI000400935D|nr:DNA topoisomerase (ATP-hydrolyzing) subunit A [Spirochaeta cellobiosiphila]